MELLKDIFQFLMERKSFWLTPMIIVLLLVGILIIAGSSSVGAFIYTIF